MLTIYKEPSSLIITEKEVFFANLNLDRFNVASDMIPLCSFKDRASLLTLHALITNKFKIESVDDVLMQI
jgi:hypothetical protein